MIETAAATEPATHSPRPAHMRQLGNEVQLLWLAFGGRADQVWLKPLRPGFRHCFAALRDECGWTVLDPLSGRTLVARLPVPAEFDLPGFYARAGLAVLGPFRPAPPRARLLPPLAPFSCVSLCRSLLGGTAPFALTPFGLYRRLRNFANNRKIILTAERASA